MKILHRTEIEKILSSLDPIPKIEEGFVQYSKGLATVPPVGELLMEKGEVHIKYGCIRADEYYVVKVASGFYQNDALGLPSSNGLMLLFSQQTGQLACALLDEGFLTDIRTAIAGAIAAKHLAPANITAIGIVGTGIQARLQALYLKKVTTCRQLIVWGRSAEKTGDYQQDMQREGFEVSIADSIDELAQSANFIVTTTPSTTPLINVSQVRQGTHITAVGSDTPEKQELASDILARANLVVADSISQCQQRGEIYQALKAGSIQGEKVVELGNVIAAGQGRADEQQITIADLTGVAVQDIKIAEAVYLASEKK
ncbi:ornithine cyclodeaminase family protein [Aliikangiella coralliicola]|uniref:Ornithine cyclodeaminase family protein n=1 Tax=Aliikangiella coralliicola TaxID=2592383 RepID=A0A545UFY1_9GAMM|nr:ornithine cyclodeaminase family protein [Aliikangiella coralliicola]TQV88381.1 ornithine cyclodeaminase family protein [Aliikangiella coralliicola]